MNNTSNPAVTFISLLDTFPASPHGTLGIAEVSKRDSSNDDGKPKTVWVNVSPYPSGAQFDPRSQAWAFQVPHWVFQKSNSE